MTKKVKIAEIARRCGVSVSTVSLVLNNRPGVARETRERVLAIATALGYPVFTPDIGDRATRLSAIRMLVKLDPGLPPQANPFYSKVILGIEDACRRKGINLLFTSLPVDANNQPLEIPAGLTNGNVDGILLVGVYVNEELMGVLAQYPGPVVLVDGYAAHERYDAVLSDNFHAAYQAVEYLLAKGHRHIGLIGGEEQCYPSLHDRRNGYLRALKDHGISHIYTANFKIGLSRGFDETTNLLKTYPQITALFCMNDEIASVAMRAAQSLGRRVPEDLSILGYDDTYIAVNTHPTLTTLHVDTLAMGRAAVELLDLRRQNPESARMTLLIHPVLVERESVASLLPQ
ncbi:LacI family DNA-binding transcriptional regulator [uncultured Thermanaerothrix sp.]|uniref:LacI family DNA-binding transcriptional regulator n=1 Tax=uncultured Thermanaerothrix sp. TaxID=1195149 RepID=UPI00261380AF|nr:LacI family DNA-binding transcriptional regulator [uncultured Thermanaerothrix sp.]